MPVQTILSVWAIRVCNFIVSLLLPDCCKQQPKAPATDSHRQGYNVIFYTFLTIKKCYLQYEKKRNFSQWLRLWLLCNKKTLSQTYEARYIFWSHRRDLNLRPTVYETVALPTELLWQIVYNFRMQRDSLRMRCSAS